MQLISEGQLLNCGMLQYYMNVSEAITEPEG